MSDEGEKKPDMLVSVRRDDKGQLHMQANVSPKEALAMLTAAVEDVRFMAFQQRMQEQVEEMQRVQVIGNMGDLLKGRR